MTRTVGSPDPRKGKNILLQYHEAEIRIQGSLARLVINRVVKLAEWRWNGAVDTGDDQ